MMPSIECRAGGAEAADWMAPPDYVIRAALDGVDRTVAEMERKWGVGRLRLLVSDLLRAKFDAQKDRLDAAIGTDREPYVRAQAEGMRRAWAVLDAAATEGGAGRGGTQIGGQGAWSHTAATGITIDSTGEAVTDKNMQPSLVVYIWERTA